MKETIIVEQFDNGITIEATNNEGTERRVSLDHSKEQEIGKMIWETVRFLMDKDLVNMVTMKIDYLSLKPMEKHGITYRIETIETDNADNIINQ